MRGALVALTASALVLLGASPAAPPDYPMTLIKVDELKRLLDAGEKADIVDVRSWSEYVELHITGARSMPLRSVPERAHEISQSGLVVFY